MRKWAKEENDLLRRSYPSTEEVFELFGRSKEAIIRQAKKLGLSNNELKSPSSNYNIIKDIEGKKFGKLTAVKLIGLKNGKTFWEFKCDCGRLKTLQANHVVNDVTKSCGCLRAENYALFFQRDLYRNHISSLKRRSRKGKVLRTLENELSFDEYVAICSLPCTYCGKIDERKYYLTGVVIRFNGVDRIDNRLGYSKSNCQPCCGRHNMSKSVFSHADYIEDIKFQYDYLRNNGKIRD